ncbi:hypothetical protein MHYP_G00291620 [Metynnis hypsauchen]
MHLLGTSVVAFILLPLAFSCKSTQPKEQISRDYQHVIRKYLEDTKISIEEQLKRRNITCTEKNFTRPLMDRATQYIHNESCKRITKDLDLADKLTRLVGAINASLGCQCSTQQWEPSKVSTHRKLCRHKYGLLKIQKAYEQYNSTP